MTYSVNQIKAASPILSYITRHYGNKVTLNTALHLVGRIQFAITNLQINDTPFKDKDVYDQVITQYLDDLVVIERI